MEEDDKGCPMIRMGVSGWVFLLVPAYPGCPGPKAVQRLCVCVFCSLRTIPVDGMSDFVVFVLQYYMSWSWRWQHVTMENNEQSANWGIYVGTCYFVCCWWLYSVFVGYLLYACMYGDSVNNTVEQNYSIFSLIWMRWLPSARACGQ